MAAEAPLGKGWLLRKHPSCEPSQGGQADWSGAKEQGHTAVQSQGQEDLHDPDMLLSLSAGRFSV